MLLNYLELLMVLFFLLIICFVGCIQPMIMISSLIIITFLYSYMMYVNMGMYWFSYVLLMVMLSGVLVVFTYMVSLIPNESFESYNMLFMFFVVMFIVLVYINNYMSDMSFLCLELWYSYVVMLNMFMVSFLFLIMLLVVWLSDIYEGAFRV